MEKNGVPNPGSKWCRGFACCSQRKIPDQGGSDLNRTMLAVAGGMALAGDFLVALREIVLTREYQI